MALTTRQCGEHSDNAKRDPCKRRSHTVGRTVKVTKAIFKHYTQLHTATRVAMGIRVALEVL